MVLECRYEGCGKICKSRAGLTGIKRRMHRAAEGKVGFRCGRCGRDMKTEGARKNHEKTCGGGRAEREGRRK